MKTVSIILNPIFVLDSECLESYQKIEAPYFTPLVYSACAELFIIQINPFLTMMKCKQMNLHNVVKKFSIKVQGDPKLLCCIPSIICTHVSHSMRDIFLHDL